MDTSEPFGPMFSNTGDKTFTIGAARDPTRWSSWADVIILVMSSYRIIIKIVSHLYCNTESKEN